MSGNAGTAGRGGMIRSVCGALGLFGALMTAFYMFRLYFLTFEGEYRGDHHTWDHAHDAPWMMGLPLAILGLLSVVSGWIGMPFAHGRWNVWDHWLHPVLERGHELVEGTGLGPGHQGGPDLLPRLGNPPPGVPGGVPAVVEKVALHQHGDVVQ